MALPPLIYAARGAGETAEASFKRADFVCFGGSRGLKKSLLEHQFGSSPPKCNVILKRFNLDFFHSFLGMSSHLNSIVVRTGSESTLNPFVVHPLVHLFNEKLDDKKVNEKQLCIHFYSS